MSLKRVIRTAREVDKQWQRWRSPHRRRLLVNARTAMNYSTIAPIVERLQGDPRLEFYFTASENPALTRAIYSDAVQPALPEKYLDEEDLSRKGAKAQSATAFLKGFLCAFAPLREKYSSLPRPQSTFGARPVQPFKFITPLEASLMQFDVYLAADFLWMKLPRGARRVQTFHGVAGKYKTVYDSPSESMRSWDRLFFINERRLRHFIECGAIDEGSPAARLIGMPKLDCLVDGSLKRDDLLSAMGIDPARRTILYAPTWSPHSSVVTMGEELVQRLGEAGYAVIVKLHDRSRDLQYVNSGGVDWGARLEPVLQKFGGVLAKGHNSSPYLAAADVMITDHSSVGFEYLLLDRPLIRIHVPELIKNTDIEPSYVDLLASAATSVTNVDEVIAAVERGFLNGRENSETRVAVANEMFYKPGTATDRAVKELYDLMELPTN